MEQRAWHECSAAEALEVLASTPDGISAAEAERRLAIHGPNSLKPPPGRPAWRRLLAQFDNLLIQVLLAAALVTAFLGHWVDCGVILGVVVINALIGFLQEGKAERAMEAIRGLLAPRALVLRDGHRHSIGADAIVPGDVVMLQSGDKVPADLRLFSVHSFAVQEAALTGESLAVEKTEESVAKDAPLGDRSCMAFAGTLVTRGQARGVVVATGAHTELGRIGAMLAAIEPLETPLVRQLDRFAKVLTLAILTIAVATFAIGWLVHEYDVAEMFLAAVGLAVAAIPEGLPAIVTIALAIGVEHMARRNAIVRRLPAVETLGSVTVICSDKTGTLTCNEMTVAGIALAGEMLSVTGAGYDPEGEVRQDGRAVSAEAHPPLAALCRAALLCNDAEIQRGEKGWRVDGDPTEGALLAMAAKAGADLERIRAVWHRLDVIPFESEHRLMATLNHDHEGHALILVKGAPEAILPRCSRQLGRAGIEDFDAQAWEQAVHALAARGQRALAVAERPAGPEQVEIAMDDVRGGLVLLGIVGMEDPPRPEAIAAVARCQGAGIRVKMITGDHAVTAGAIAARLGLRNAEVVTGPELDATSDEALPALAERVDVFARAAPEHKLRLVQALQASGQVAAMTGDGVNDAPALRRADVGVAMGKGGTEAAKEAAEVVLGDDNFASIVTAVEEGRRIYDNIKKAVVFILPTNGGQAFTIALAVALGSALPIIAVQILWVNMVTAVTLALALAFARGEADLMERPPRPPGQPLLSRFLAWRILFVSLVLVAGTFGGFLWMTQTGASVEAARSMAVNMLVLGEVGYLLNMTRLHEPADMRRVAGDRIMLGSIVLVLALQGLFTHWGPMQALFQTAALSPGQWAACAAFAILVFVVVEAEKAVLRRIRRRARAR